MDLIITYKSRFRLWIVWVFLVICLFSSFAHSWRISQKCPHGHYYNDGCTACWCDVQTGLTKCEPLSKCARRNHVKCPSGRRYKDSCGNDCVCYEATGAVLCNERQKCRQDVPTKLHVTPTPISPSIDNNLLLRRGGLPAPYIPPIEEYPIRFEVPDTTTPSPQHRSPSATTTSRYRNNMFYENVAIESTPHPRVRIPSTGKSEELIIEPAIIIRKKGSNKASIVRNPSSATSVTLPSSRHRNHDQDLIISKSDTDKLSSSSRSASLAPLHLYEKQLQTILNIRRAYSQLLRSKVNFNFQIATGKVPSSIPGIPSSTDHPRRFDSDYDNNSTILTNTTPSPPMFITNQQPKPPPDNVQVKPFQPLVWRKEIKNVLKQFSPVPPLRQLVSYVTTSTENYLRDFLNRNRLQQPIQMFQESTTLPPPSPEPPTVPPHYTTPQPEHSYPFPSFSTIQPFEEHHFDPNTMPVHEVYQNHDFKMLATTSNPLPQSYPPHNSYLHKTLGSQSLDPQPFFPNEHSRNGEQFPFMDDLLREIARIDNVPTSTPNSTPSLTAVPTFSTPGPPYAAIEEVRPLSFLPPPQPEPATPTRRTYTNNGHEHSSPILYQQQQHPTVRVNLDKPIYINPPPQQPQQRYPPPPQRPHIQQNFHPPSHHSHIQQNFHPPLHQPHYPTSQQQRFPPLPQPILPHQTNRRVYAIPHRPYIFAPPPLQQPHQHSQPMQRHHINPQQHNIQYRPIFPQFFIPKPKQYRLVLKGNVRDAAVRVDDAVPRFVSKIAHEFFKKPEIYIPKIRPGKPLTLEKVILNHKEIVPTAMSFSPTPGVPPTKLRFTPQAQWEMKEEMAKQGIMLDEPLTTQMRDYVANDPNVMEMDAPLKAVQTWESHSPMDMGTFTDHQSTGGNAQLASIPQIIQQASTQQQQQQQLYNPILFPSPTPPQITSPPPTLDYQHQQELQHQIMLAQQEQQRQQNTATSLISSNLNQFKIDYGDFNDFKHDGQAGSQHVFPQELQLPGVEQVVVDKYLVQDPSGGIQMFSTTTIQPPTINANTNIDISSILNQHHRNGLAALPAHGPTPPPAVLVRHHGAPSSPTTTPPPPPTQAPSIFAASYPTENFLVTIINSTPQPFVTTTIAPIENTPSVQVTQANTGMISQSGGGSSLVSQIQDFLAEEMDFGARPQMNFYDLLFQQRTGEFSNTESQVSEQDKNVNTYGEDAEATENDEQREDQIATETKASGEDPDPNVDTDKLANIFSMDYKNKNNNKKPPAVIVIKVPPDHSDGPFPKVVEKRRGEEIEIQGGPINSKGNPEKTTSVESSTEKSIVTSTSKSVASSENDSNDDDDSSSSREDSSSAKRRRNKKNRKRKRRRRKKKNRNKQRKDDDLEDDKRDQDDDKSADKKPTIDPTKDNEKSKEENSETTTTPKTSDDESKPEVAAEEKFQAELDWKSQLMANICDLNPSSPLCLTYRSICLLMTSDE